MKLMSCKILTTEIESKCGRMLEMEPFDTRHYEESYETNLWSLAVKLIEFEIEILRKAIF